MRTELGPITRRTRTARWRSRLGKTSRGLCTVLLVLGTATIASAHDGGAAGGDAEVDARAEGLIHTPRGFEETGQPTTVDAAAFGTVIVRVTDAATGLPTPCRVNLVGADGNFYEPEGNALTTWSLHRTGNRAEKGPFRYYGWFFYSVGEFVAKVPVGKTRIEVWKGFEYGPVSRDVELEPGETRRVDIVVDRVLDMAAQGWYSGDTHIHLNRRRSVEERNALTLLEAEDIRFGFLLAMNDGRNYEGTMATQEWPQSFGLGRSSVVRRGPYQLSSGQEYRCRTYGHICLLMSDRLVFADRRVDPDDWPPFVGVVEETRRLNGVAIHAHGGYEKEIYADYVASASDGVELLQFAVYRGIGLEGWYHILNAGFRFPAVGASDYPYCRALGDCRTYAKIDGAASFDTWTDAVVAGRSFFTTGPLLEFLVNGAGPGDTVVVAQSASELQINVAMTSAVAPVEAIDIIANGRVVKRLSVESGSLPQRVTVRTTIPCVESMWVGRAGAWQAVGRTARCGSPHQPRLCRARRPSHPQLRFCALAAKETGRAHRGHPED